jgi:hypothetical protein
MKQYIPGLMLHQHKVSNPTYLPVHDGFAAAPVIELVVVEPVP